MHATSRCFLDRGMVEPYTSLYGQVAEWLRSGLQSREHRFESGPGLQYSLNSHMSIEKFVTLFAHIHPRFTTNAKQNGQICKY